MSSASRIKAAAEVEWASFGQSLRHCKTMRTCSAAFAVVLASLLVGGCATSVRTPGWPVTTYDYTCRPGSIPWEPTCLTTASYDGGFKYSDEFQACKQSMFNYTTALEEYYRCSETRLRSVLDGLLVSVPETYNCYEKFFRDIKEGDPSVTCPPVEAVFLHSYEADGLEINLGVPRCIAKSESYNFAPKRAYRLDDCREQVEVFLGKARTSYSWSSDAHSAQEQYDTYVRNLRYVIDQKRNDAVRKFNCMAEGNTYCP